MDDPIDQTFFSDYPKAFTPDHTVSEMAALVFDLVVAIFDDEFGDVMFCGNNDGVAFFEWRSAWWRRPPTLRIPSGSIIGLRFISGDDFEGFFPLFMHWISFSNDSFCTLLILKSCLKRFGEISKTFFKSREKKLRLTPLLFGRFWALFPLF